LDLEINLKISSNGNKCPICESGKSIEECLKMNKQECGKDESCSMSVRIRGGRIESVNFECKQQNACKNEKIQNGMKWGQGQCTPAKPNGPSLCRQCCQGQNCVQKFRQFEKKSVWRKKLNWIRSL